MAASVPPSSGRELLERAVRLTAGYGGPASHAAGEPVFTALPELAQAVAWAAAAGTEEDVLGALHVANVLGAAWERLGEPDLGRQRLDAVLAAATRVGLRDHLAVARVLRRRARLAMTARHDAEAHKEADEDLHRAYDIAAAHDDPVTVSLLLDRADLAMRRGRWDEARDLVPELLRRTEATGDPLLQAMGLNRAGWAAFGSGDRESSQERYERAWALAELHEDPVVEARTAAGLGTLAMLRGEQEHARRFWHRALDLAEQVHDRGFTLHCLDGVAALLVLRGEEAAGTRLAASASALREALHQPREEALRRVQEVVPRAELPVHELWSYAEAVAAARQSVGR